MCCEHAKLNRRRRAVIPALLWGAMVMIGGPYAAADSDDVGWISFTDSAGHIVFDATINGEPAEVIVDSGADSNLLSEEFAARAEIGQYRRRNVKLTGIHGEQNISLSREFDLTVNELTFPMHDIPVTPGGNFDLILGRWLFHLAVVQIDYPNRRVRFLPPDAMKFEGNIRYRGGNAGEPLVAARIHGKRAWLLIDTGNAGITMLKRRFVKRHDLDAYGIDGAQLQTRGVITSGETQLLQLEDVELGPFRLDRFLAGYIPEHNQGFDGQRQRTFSRLNEDKSREDGLLGYELLQNFIVTMDLKRRKVHLALPQPAGQ